MGKWLGGIAALVVVVVGAYFVLGQSGNTWGRGQVEPGPEAEAEPVHAVNSVVAEGRVVPVKSANLSLPVGGIVAEAEVRRARAELELIQAGSRPETVAMAEAEVAAARAALEQARVSWSETMLRAPFAGTVALLEAEVGEHVTPGSPIVRLADLEQWRVETTDLTELQVARVKEAQTVTVSVDGLPDLELTGIVERIKPFGENKQGDITYTVLVKLDRQDPRLHWNMTTTVTIEAQ